LLVAIIVMQAWCLCRTDEKPDRKSDDGVNGSTMTVSTTRSQRRENPINSTERRPFITPQQGSNNGHAVGNNQQRQFNNFPITHDVAGSQQSLNS